MPYTGLKIASTGQRKVRLHSMEPKVAGLAVSGSHVVMSHGHMAGSGPACSVWATVSCIDIMYPT